MTRTQIQLPDDLYRRAKAFAAERELSLAEVTRRGLEIFLARFPEPSPARDRWQLPKVDGGGILIPLTDLRDVASKDRELRSLASQ